MAAVDTWLGGQGGELVKERWSQRCVMITALVIGLSKAGEKGKESSGHTEGRRACTHR